MDQGTEVALAPREPVQGRKAGPGLCKSARWGSRREACVSCRGALPSTRHHCWGAEPMCSPGPQEVCGPLCAKKKKQLPLRSGPQYQAEERETPSQTRQTGGKQSEWTKWGQSQGTCPMLQPVTAPPSLVTPVPTPPQTEWQSSLSPPPARQPSAAQAAQSPRPAHPPGMAAFFCLSSARRQALEEQGFRGSFVTLDEPQHLESHAWPSTVIDRAQSLV